MVTTVVVSGSRNYTDRFRVHNTISKFLREFVDLVDNTDYKIIAGCARGPDAFALEYARVRGINHEKYAADWNKHGKAAGPIRNEQMARDGDALIAFWDGKSRGTKDMINRAKRKGLAVHVIMTEENTLF